MEFDYDNLTEQDLLFNDDEYLTEEELIDYAEYLYENDLTPEDAESCGELPQKIVMCVGDDKYKKNKVFCIINSYISNFTY